jgi:PAS domain S-box-containing protein
MGETLNPVASAAPASVLTALRQAPLGVAIFDNEMRYLAASSQFLTDQGLPGDTPLVGRVHYEVFPNIPQRWRDLHARVLREGVELRHEADPYQRPDGSTDLIRWSLSPWRTATGEIGGLVLYSEVVTRAVEARLRLEAAEAQYRAMFDQVAVGVARISLEGRFLEVNDRFCAIVGYAREALRTRTLREITHTDDQAAVEQVHALVVGIADNLAIEQRLVASDGDAVWVNLTASLVRREGEPDYFVAVIEDIGARKAAETLQQRYQDQLKLLINELNHRVKNTLATVQSMAAQTMRRAEDPQAAYEDFEARLVGLAEVHDVLTREQWHGAPLGEVANRALRPFLGERAEHVRVAGPQVWLEPGATLTMALLFHELATNAVKYGALSTDAGRVDLTWTFDAAERRLGLVWRESGGPPVTPPKRKGFGSRLIHRALGGELRGAAELTYDPAGVRCMMQAVLPPVGEAPMRLPQF